MPQFKPNEHTYKLKISRKLANLARIIRTFKNWYIFVLDYLKLLRGDGIIIYNFRKGVKCKAIKGSTDRSVIWEVFIAKSYTPPGFNIGENEIVIDIGAHKGYFSVFAATRAKGVRVYSYEPFHQNFELLKENIKLNNLERRIKAFNLGVAKNGEKRRLYISERDARTSNIYTEYGERVEINCTTLKDIFDVENKIERCDFLKMDCEGAEYEILLNTPQEILKRIKKISLEFHSISGYSHINLKDFLERAGFEIKFFTWPEAPQQGMLYASNSEFT